jgi:hypothetical protein
MTFEEYSYYKNEKLCNIIDLLCELHNETNNIRDWKYLFDAFKSIKEVQKMLMKDKIKYDDYLIRKNESI